MRPILFHLGGVGISAFFFMIMVGALATTFYGAHRAKKEGEDPVVMLDFGIIAIIASVVGARIFHILVESPSYYIEHPIRVFYFWEGGFVSLGAFIASVFSWIAYLKIRKLDIWKHIDLAVTAIPIVIFFVRLACLLAGCCYGKPTDFFINLVFNNPGSRAALFGFLGVPLHATQVYFMANAIVMFFVLRLVQKYKKFYGQTSAAFMLYYGITRFFIEFMRGDDDRGLWLGKMLSTGQVVMSLTFIGGIILWLALKYRNKIGE